MGQRSTMYNAHESRYYLSTIYPPNAYLRDRHGGNKLRDFKGGIIWNDYTKFDHGPLAANFGYKSDIKTTSISNQGHVVAYLRCRDVTSDSVSSSYHPVTGTSQVRADVFDTPYRRTPDSHYNYSLKEKDRQRSLLFETTIEGIDPGPNFITSIFHEVENVNTEKRNDKLATRPLPFELSGDGDSIVVGSGLYRRNGGFAYRNYFFMENPWQFDRLRDIGYTQDFINQIDYENNRYSPLLIDNAINEDGTVIAGLWGYKWDEQLESPVRSIRNSYDANTTARFGYQRRHYIISVWTSGQSSSSWDSQIRFFTGNRCNNISLTASGDLVAYAMTEDNWHNNYYESPTFYKDGNKNVKPDMRRGYINFLENENIGHTPPT